ncbi:putative ascorbate peroxidase [Watersipora subatra]|uniref:putative ascorbate peroxidase n=1 Tax=Watersipora subatra TaxID=2589382 RepID=UPI00355B2277
MAKFQNLFCIAIALLARNLTVNGLNTVEVTDLRAQIRQMIIDEPIEEGRQANDQVMIAGLVRLSFHDCVGPQCDGCINHDNAENAGLQVYIDRAEILYNSLQVAISRADFWALAGVEAVTFAAEKANSPHPDIQFRYGRLSCQTSPITTDLHTFPSSLGDTDHVLQFFQNQFNFDAKETTAILGAHTLGNAHRQNSGFVHPWVTRKHQLDNAFYSELQDATNGWNQRSIRQGGVTRWFWESTTNPQLLMLNTDMCLIKDMSSADAEGMVNCDYNSCPTPPGVTDAWVTSFAIDNALWITEFAAAFEKMIESGWTGQLSLPGK